MQAKRHSQYEVDINGVKVVHGWKEVYDIACPHCQHEMVTTPSMFHIIGESDMGYGKCADCDQPMRVVHNPADNTMSTSDILTIKDKSI